MISPHKVSLWISFLALLALVSPLHAEEPVKPVKWYDIELIIFSDKHQLNIEAETWPEEQAIEGLDTAVELVASNPLEDALPKAFQRLASEQLMLGDKVKRIEKSSQYELLMHIGWRQPGYEREETKAVYLMQPFTEEAETDKEAEKIDLFAMAGVEVPSRLEGLVRLTLARYLHIDADLVYRIPVEIEQEQTSPYEESYPDDTMSQESNIDAAQAVASGYEYADRASASHADLSVNAETVVGTPGFRGFQLQESRRMRSNELHYLDHPMFGIIVQVRPYELPEVPEEAALPTVSQTESTEPVSSTVSRN